MTDDPTGWFEPLYAAAARGEREVPWDRDEPRDLLVGDPSKAKRELGWVPKTSFEELIRLMVRSDLELLSK